MTATACASVGIEIRAALQVSATHESTGDYTGDYTVYTVSLKKRVKLEQESEAGTRS